MVIRKTVQWHGKEGRDERDGVCAALLEATC